MPDNVIGILADCGYSSAKEIIRLIIGKMGLPVKLSYPVAPETYLNALREFFGPEASANR